MSRLVVLWCLISGLASAQSLSEAEALYGDGDLGAALKMADGVLKRAKDTRETGRLQSLRGLVLLAQGKKDKARAAFVLALQADSGVQLDGQRDPPAAVALFEQARESMPPGSLSVSSTLRDATLRIDGVDLGPLPLTTKVAIGRRTLEATAVDGRVSRAEVLVKSGETQAVQLNAPPQAAELQSASPPLIPAEAPADIYSRSATLLDQPGPRVKMTWWGLIPIIVAAGAGWLGPPLLASGYSAGFGVPASLATIAALGLGVALLVQSSVHAEVLNGESPRMKWWGLIPLGIGAAALIVTLVTLPWLGIDYGTWAPPIISSSFAIVGLGIGGGMLIGQALGLPASAPRVSVYALPQGGGGLSVVGRF